MKITDFTTEELVKELVKREETEVIGFNYKDTDEIYLGDYDKYLDGKGIILIVKGV